MAQSAKKGVFSKYTDEQQATSAKPEPKKSWLDTRAEETMDEGSSAGVDPRPVRHMQTWQYRHPERNVLPPSKYKPTALTKFQDQSFRSLAAYLPDYIKLPSNMPNNEELQRYGATRIPNSLVKVGDNVDYPPNFQSTRNRELVHWLGLGSATTSMGYDPDKKKPYLSIFDSWDFKNNPGSEYHLGFDKLEAMGKPFNVYDRVYMEPEDIESGTIPTRQRRESMVGDIELPDPKAKSKTKIINRSIK